MIPTFLWTISSLAKWSCLWVCLAVGHPVLRAQAREDVLLLPAAAEEGSEEWEESVGLLGVGRDLFLRRASFDFSAGFFRIRGYDRREQALYLNDIPLNSLYDGRPQWSRLGGLTDIGRYSEVFLGRDFSPFGFGGILGLQSIQARPATLRPGNRITFSAANRSYRWRQMLTYNSGLSSGEKGSKGLGFLVSCAHRHGQQGYFQGTPYRSFAGYVAVEWRLSPIHRFMVSGLYNHFNRGQSAPVGAEVLELLGPRYNPDWGWSEGRRRPSRLRLGSQPLVSLHYHYQGKRSSYRFVGAYLWGSQSRTRVAYFDGPNPSPVYYRYLPSFYLNASFGPNFFNADRAEQALLARPQLDWEGLERSNRSAFKDGQAVYLITGDERRQREWSFRGLVQYKPSAEIRLDGGLEYRLAQWHVSSRIQDLLGASYHMDRDPFSDTRNDVEGPERKQEGDLIGYSYRLDADRWQTHAQVQWAIGHWQAGIAGRYGMRRIRRVGRFVNERYPQESGGKSEMQETAEWGWKAGLQYRISGRQWVTLHFGTGSDAPLPRDVYIDPRQHGRIFPNSGNAENLGATVNLHLRYPFLKGRVTAYYQQFSGGRSLRSYFTEARFGSAFIREVVSGISSQHRGLEWGLEVQVRPSLTLHFAGAVGAATYAGAPQIRLYTDPGPDRPQAFSEDGSLDIGAVDIEGYPLSRGPQTALSLGLGYRDPKFWWMDLRLVYLDRNYLSPAYLRYTEVFATPEDPFSSISDSRALAAARALERLPPIYLLNLSIGKSWLKGRHYISAFVGLNNLFETESITGGYHQGRLATLEGFREDQISRHPSFGPRYFQGYGRTFFINLSWSF